MFTRRRKWIVAIVLVVCVGVIAVLIYGTSKTYVISLRITARFSQEEVQAAAEYVLAQFENGYKGCKLKRIYYDDAESLRLAATYIDEPQYDIYGMDPDDIIVLFSDFRTGAFPPGGFGKNQNYNGWTWYLIRDGKGEPWREYSHGYC